MSWSFFILGVLFLPDIVFWWWAERRLRRYPITRFFFRLYMAGMVSQVLWILLWPATARQSHFWLPTSWIAATYLWHLMVLPFALFAIGARKALPVRKDRRQFLAACVAVGPPLVTAAAVVPSLLRMHDFRVQRLKVPVAGLPDALEGLTIAHVSDIHYGKFTTEEWIDRIVEATNTLGADLVLFTGDLIDLTLEDLPAAIEVLRRFDRRQGLFLCEGNHDLIDDGDAFRRQVSEAGFVLLLDQASRVSVRDVPVQIVGAHWKGDMARVRALRDPDAFPILLAHHPHRFDEADCFPLTLSGHTHGGQIMLSERLGAGPVLFRYWSGVYRRNGRTLVVSNGIGNWFPLRTHAPAEIGHLTLVRYEA